MKNSSIQQNRKQASNNVVSISESINNWLSNHTPKDWNNIEQKLRTTIRKMLNQQRYAKSLASIMMISVDEVVDELVSNLKVSLLNNDNAKLRSFGAQDDNNFEKWIYVSSMGRAKTLYNKACKIKNQQSGLEFIANMAEDQSDEQYAVNEKLKATMEAIKSLSKGQRQAMEMTVRYPDLSSKERAKLLCITETKFNKRIFDARKNLRIALAA